MEKYKLILEDCCNGYILDTEKNEIVVLVETKRPDLEFKALKELLEKVN